MKRLFVALLACSCQVLTLVEDDGGVIVDGGAGGGVAGGAAGGGSTAGGSGGGGAGAGGGGGGGGAGGGCVTCTTGSCGVGCGGDLCREGSGTTCNGGLCTLPRPQLSTGDLTSVWGTAPNDVWVTEEGRYAFHWNGSAWGCLPALPENNDVWSNRDEAWIVGHDDGGRLLRFRWDGGTTHFGGTTSGLTLGTLHSVWGNGSGAVWASEVGTVVAVTAQGQLSRQTFSPASVCRDLKGLPGGPPVLVAGGNGNVFRGDGGSWVREDTMSPVQLHGVFPQANGEDFAIDGVGRVKRRLGGSWGDDGPQLYGNGTALGGGDGELYASIDLGSSGTLFRRDPSLGWQEVLSTSSALRDVWVAPDRSVFVVGNRGRVLRYQPPDCAYPTLPIADGFDTPLDAGRWAIYDGVWQTTGGQLIGGNNATDPSTGVRATLARPGLLNASLAVEVVQVAQMNMMDVDVGTLLIATYSRDAGMTTLKIELSDGRMRAYAGLPGDVLASPLQPSGGVRHLRIREDGGTLYFEAASATGTLQAFHTMASPAFLPIIDTVQLGIFKNPGALSRPAIFDNLNRCPRP